MVWIPSRSAYPWRLLLLHVSAGVRAYYRERPLRPSARGRPIGVSDLAERLSAVRRQRRVERRHQRSELRRARLEAGRDTILLEGPAANRSNGGDDNALQRLLELGSLS